MAIIGQFSNEIEKIKNDKLRSFTVDALSEMPEYVEDNKQFIEATKSAFKIARIFCDSLKASDNLYDFISVAMLVQDVDRYQEFDDVRVENHAHPITLRTRLMFLKSEVGEEDFNDIMTIVESSHGLNSPIPHVIPEMNAPVYLWIVPFANNLSTAL